MVRFLVPDPLERKRQLEGVAATGYRAVRPPPLGRTATFMRRAAPATVSSARSGVLFELERWPRYSFTSREPESFFARFGGLGVRRDARGRPRRARAEMGRIGTPTRAARCSGFASTSAASQRERKTEQIRGDAPDVGRVADRVLIGCDAHRDLRRVVRDVLGAHLERADAERAAHRIRAHGEA